MSGFNNAHYYGVNSGDYKKWQKELMKEGEHSLSMAKKNKIDG